ncbi:MAG: hypothetical protein EBU92_13920 [Betaproteobacteria bacterium]|nr:hypothetical protein [Betaproteobacteria bacterium]
MNGLFFRLAPRALLCGLLVFALPHNAWAQNKTLLRISSPAVPQDWHAKMWTVFKENLEKSAPGECDVQIYLNSSLFKQAAEPAAMARGNLELSTLSAADLSRQVPYFSVFTAGYVIRDVAHQQKVFNGPIGEEGFKQVSERMGIKVLATAYLGTRQLVLREPRIVKTPADLKGIKLRMPAAKEWLFLGESLGATATPLSFGEVYMGLKTGTIVAAEKVEKADKLLKLQVDLGTETRTIVSGIALHHQPENIIGQKVVVVTNLAPRKMRGIESNGMILMAEDADGKLVFVNSDVANGSSVS